MDNLPNIDFEGIIVKPKNGVYKCPYHCGVTGYPIPKWKTEKGFQQHIKKCHKRPSLIKSRQEEETNDRLLFEKMKEEIISTLPYKIGQKLFYVKEIIVKPTHVMKFNRMVKVRYEEEKDFQAREDELKYIDVQYPGFVPKEVETLKFYVRLNGFIKISSLCQNMEEAKKKASDDMKSYKEYCDFASFCR